MAAAYSLRRLRSAYAGTALNIRRSSDSAVQDIGFNASNGFDTAGYAGFVGAGSAFSAKWYDQSGNAADGIQATAGNQPTVAPDGIGYAVNTVQGSGQFLAAADAAPTQNVFATGGLLQVALHSTQTVAEGSIVSKGAWVLYTYPGGGDQQLWFYVKAATSAGFWGTSTVMSAAGRHIVTVAYNASTPTTPPVITLDGATCSIGTVTNPVGAITTDVGSALEISNNVVINTNNRALSGSIYEAILLRGIPLPGVAGALVSNAKSFYSIP